MAENEKEEVKSPMYHFMAGGEFPKVKAPYFLISLFILCSCMKQTVQSCRKVRLSGHISPQYKQIVSQFLCDEATLS